MVVNNCELINFIFDLFAVIEYEMNVTIEMINVTNQWCIEYCLVIPIKVCSLYVLPLFFFLALDHCSTLLFSF